MPRYPFESEYLYGLHDPGGEGIMRDAGCKGWILFTEAIGADPGDPSGSGRYVGLSGEGFGVIVRLNNGYKPNGTIPCSGEYAHFAQRCANFVGHSPGAKIWIIGNETNFVVERPGVGREILRALPMARGGGEPSARELRDLYSLGPGQMEDMLSGTRDLGDSSGEAITPELYTECYALCREAIHSLPGHDDDLVLTSPVAPWNINTAYEGNPSGDWIQYFQDILTRLGPDRCDGIALHTYTHGYSPDLVDQDTFLDNPAFSHRRLDFRTYIDFMEAIPPTMRHLPVYITEADQNDAWEDRPGSSWVQRAYAEIDRWNSDLGHQQVRAMVLYRWPKIEDDKWWIDGKNHIIEDFRRAMDHRYRWHPEATGATVLTSSGFSPGQVVCCCAVVNVRRAPGHLNKPNGDVRGQVGYGVAVSISGPPTEKDGLTWWPVRSTSTDEVPIDGWMAEVAPDGRRLLSVEVPGGARSREIAPLG